MEKLSDNLKSKLRAFTQEWIKERGNDEIWINSSVITMEGLNYVTTINLDELMNDNNGLSEEETLLTRCKRDLEQAKAEDFNFPEYRNLEEAERLHCLIKKLNKTQFRQKSATERLEIYYYLGEVLASRGWIRTDKRKLQEQFEKRTTKEIIRTARRIYELFEARGIAYLYVITYIRPTYIIQLKEEEFYGELIPFARKLKEKEWWAKGSQELTALEGIL